MRCVRWLVSLFVLGAIMSLAGRSASAQTCTITTTPVPFGVYDVFSTVPLSSTGSLTYSCRGGVDTITIWMSKGLYGPSNNPRQMASGTDRLDYYLCQDANCNTLWGDQQYPPSYGPFKPLNNTNVALPIYGRIPVSQDVSAGNYTDNIIIGLNF